MTGAGKPKRFQAEIKPGRAGAAYVEVPLDVRRALGKPGAVPVRATLDGTAFPSVMHATTGGQWTPTLSADDAKVIRTLYSNYQDGNLCSYVDGFRTPPVF